MHGGRENIGINYGSAGGAAQEAETRAAIADLRQLLQELRPHLTPDQDRTVGDALPVLDPDRDTRSGRGTVLASVVRIAEAVGSVGKPAAEAARRLTELLS
ncbi:hypothetical protein AB0O07_12915 [Streptomyces sp. NPDC093085]|uniref:hypothetical protein n=1 Tax=Streptomyces sp. NPDC093085 TaxID=3155068 RepID=UPI003434222F